VKLELSVEDRPFAPGEWIHGRVEVLEGGRSRRLSVMLHQRDSTADYAGTIRTIETAELHSGDLTAPASLEFALQVPPDALPNYSDPLGSTFWELDARSDEPGMDTHARKRIVVALSGR
jgi:hypothetical protein